MVASRNQRDCPAAIEGTSMDTVAQLSKRERIDLFQEASARKGNMSPAIVEKDFWVCWTLKRLFTVTDNFPRFIFKGGTSLSKVFKLIGRFSEDIDLSCNRGDLGFVGEKDPSKNMSGKKRERLLNELEASCVEYIADSLIPALREKFSTIIGNPQEVDLPWSLAIDKEDPQTILFSYPAAVPESETGILPYIQPVIRLEIGARSDQWPSGEYDIQPYAAEVFPELFEVSSCSINTLQVKRTFWEKATLLHAEFYRPPGKKIGDRLSRHYYDLACLAQSPIRGELIQDLDLLEAVVSHKNIFFRSAWASYETARVGTFRLMPPSNRIHSLKIDYRKMEEMFFEEPPPFESILETLEKLEHEINDK